MTMLTVVILTQNEQANLPDCLAAIECRSGFATPTETFEDFNHSLLFPDLYKN